MATWQTPVTNWTSVMGVLYSDMNRIEGNTQWLHDQIGAASGIATLDATSKLTASQLPIATATALGGVKQGSNITIAGDGTITANAQSSTKAEALNTQITGTAAQQIFTFTPAAQGMFELKLYLRATSAVTATATINYTDSGGAQTYTPSAVNSSSIATGSHGVVSYAFEALSTAAITLSITAGTANLLFVTAALTQL